MMTHEARERDMRAALAAIDKLPVVAAADHHDPGRGVERAVAPAPGAEPPRPDGVVRDDWGRFSSASR